MSFANVDFKTIFKVAPLSATFALSIFVESKLPVEPEAPASLNVIVLGELCSLTMNEIFDQSKYDFRSSPLVVSILSNL